MRSSEIRKQFIEYFEKKAHKFAPSAPVVPYNDPTLLFTNAGMNQFKDVFLGTGSRDYTRAVNTQKCIRVSGKHNDLEEVGHDTYHHTFFEMLGNWSFGDYYKKEAIGWAWELLTDVWKLPKERLWATVYRTDDEALELWKSETDIAHDHIVRFDEKDNFWEMGETGPCGPCSEIHINLTDDYDNPAYVNAGKPECIEIWNLVFIQYNRDQNGVLTDLPAKHVDTGMGFERVCAVMQGKSSNYDTDCFVPILEQIQKLTGVPYEKEEQQIAMRVIADHIRTLTFAIADGAMPGNEGRGYVLRRLLRRAARYARKLQPKLIFLYKLVDVLVDSMGDVFPEIKEKQNHVKNVIQAEEESFHKTLDRGVELFEHVIEQLRAAEKTTVSGEDAFKLYDTYGFPVDLTRVMAQELGYSVDESRFTELMAEQKARAREATRQKMASVNIQVDSLEGFALNENVAATFLGYESLTAHATIRGIKHQDDIDFVILDKTPFYVESGGQVDDTGAIAVAGSEVPVIDMVKIQNEIVHVVANSDGLGLETGLGVLAKVDSRRRWDIMRNHSATHFMHAALRTILGGHVQQAGSYVGPEHLRFDFTHLKKVSAAELHDIEVLVNEELRKNIPLFHHRNIPIEEAKKMGALMFFGDKYGDRVNVVQFGDFSVEFCGGTHVSNSSEIGLFKIISEASIASGVRRIEAVTGAGIEQYILKQHDRLREAEEKYAHLTDAKKKVEKELAELKQQASLQQLPALLASAEVINGLRIVTGVISIDSMESLREFGNKLSDALKDGVALVAAEIDGKVGLVCVAADALVKQKGFNAGKTVGEIAKMLGGNGGGRPNLATAGAKDVERIPEALALFRENMKNAAGGN